MKHFFFYLLICLSATSYSQTIDSVPQNRVIVHSDYRLEILAKKESEINTAILKSQARSARGYRLMVLNTYDRDYALKVRSELLQKFPDQKPYMWYANPYIKLKFGNFRTKEEAEDYKSQISRMLNGASIYLLSETIEVKPDKDFNPDDMKWGFLVISTQEKPPELLWCWKGVKAFTAKKVKASLFSLFVFHHSKL